MELQQWRAIHAQTLREQEGEDAGGSCEPGDSGSGSGKGRAGRVCGSESSLRTGLERDEGKKRVPGRSFLFGTWKTTGSCYKLLIWGHWLTRVNFLVTRTATIYTQTTRRGSLLRPRLKAPAGSRRSRERPQVFISGDGWWAKSGLKRPESFPWLLFLY